MPNVTRLIERGTLDEWPQNIREKHAECYGI